VAGRHQRVRPEDTGRLHRGEAIEQRRHAHPGFAPTTTTWERSSQARRKASSMRSSSAMRPTKGRPGGSPTPLTMPLRHWNPIRKRRSYCLMMTRATPDAAWFEEVVR
jgi:hypothetical protein